MFDAMIWTGTALTLLGLVILVWCILRAARVRRAQLPDDELRAALMALLPVNLGALLLSAVGLMLVVLGVILR
ncbi:MAG: hypothetical protein ACK5MY_11240 [Jhaorihella sp.]